MCFVMSHGLVCHALPLGYISLVDYLAVKDLRGESVCQSDEQQQDACIYSDILQ